MSLPRTLDLSNIGVFQIAGKPGQPDAFYRRRWKVLYWCEELKQQVGVRRFYTRWRMLAYVRRLRLHSHQVTPEGKPSMLDQLKAFLNLDGWGKHHTDYYVCT